MTAIETMKKDYKSDEDIIDELMKTPEAVVDFDRTWNGRYEFMRCGDCDGPMLGYREEKRRNPGQKYVRMARMPFAGSEGFFQEMILF